MKNIRKLSIIGILILVLIIAIVTVIVREYVEKDIKFKQVFNSISYFDNANSTEIDELNTKNVYIFDTEKQWKLFRERYLQGEPIPNIILSDNEKIIFIHTKWEDLNWGNSYNVNSINKKGNKLNILIEKNGKVEKYSGFPESAFVHGILICKVDGKKITDSIIVDLIKEE